MQTPYPEIFPSNEIMYMYRYLTGDREGRNKYEMIQCCWITTGFVLKEVFKEDKPPVPVGSTILTAEAAALKLKELCPDCDCDTMTAFPIDVNTLLQLYALVEQIVEIIWRELND